MALLHLGSGKRMESRVSLLLFLIILASMFSYIFSLQPSSWEVDRTAVVARVVDGDTFDISSGDTVRLADINAPEKGENGYDEAKDLLASLVTGKTVFLDVDDVSRVDRYGRLVCVVYVDYNSTHVMNVNKAMVTRGVAEIWEHGDNEFNPYLWSLYVERTATQIAYIGATSIILLLTVALMVHLCSQKRRRR